MPSQYARNVDLERATAIRVSLIEHSQANLVAREAELDVSMFSCLPHSRAENSIGSASVKELKDWTVSMPCLK